MGSLSGSVIASGFGGELADVGVPPAMTPTVLATLRFRIEQVGGGAAMELTDGSIAMCVCTPAEVGEVDSGAASSLVVDEACTVAEAAVMGIDAAVFWVSFRRNFCNF